MAKIYAIANQKGGVGKSTTCLCLGAALGEENKLVLLIDFDPQAGLTASLGFKPDSFSGAKTIYEALMDQVSLAEVIIKTNIERVDLVPSKLDLAGAEAELMNQREWHKALRRVLTQIKDSDYDYVLIDCPPSLGVLTTNALVAAHQVIIPVQVEYLAMMGLKQLNQIIEGIRKRSNPQLKARILRTMRDRRTLHTKEVSEELEKIFGAQVYKAIINKTIKFADATYAGEPILTFASRSEAAEAYRNLAKEVLNHEQKEKTNQGS